MADRQPRPRGASCLFFLMHSLHIPGRNLGIFVPVFALNVAYVGFADHAYSLAQHGVLRPNDMAAAYLLCAFLGPAVRVVTASAAVVGVATSSESSSEQQHGRLSWRLLIADTLRGSVKAAGPVATVVDGSILLLATQAAGAVTLQLLQMLVMWNRCYLTPQLIDLLVALHAAHRLLQGYVRAVSSVAVVVSVSSSSSSSSSLSQSQPATACHGRAALRRAWRLSRENATRTVVLVATEVLVTGAILRCYESAVEHDAPEYGWYVYLLLSGSALMFSVCVATAFYYQCPQSVDSDAAAAPPAAGGRGGWRQQWVKGKEWIIGSCTSQWSTNLRDIVQGRRSMRQVLATMKTMIRYWKLWVLSFVPRHPLELWFLAAVICAWLVPPTENIPSIFGQNSLLLYRSSLRSTYRATLNIEEGRICPKPNVKQFNPLSTIPHGTHGGNCNEQSKPKQPTLYISRTESLPTHFNPLSTWDGDGDGEPAGPD